MLAVQIVKMYWKKENRTPEGSIMRRDYYKPAGKVLFNYRYTGYHGQHYEQYCMYFLNTDSLTHNAFVQAEYTYEYDRLADLF